MSRQGIIKKQTIRLNKMIESIKNSTRSQVYILKQIIVFEDIEKEIQIQEAYLQHEVAMEDQG